jgi:hypothetical protein
MALIIPPAWNPCRQFGGLANYVIKRWPAALISSLGLLFISHSVLITCAIYGFRANVLNRVHCTENFDEI